MNTTRSISRFLRVGAALALATSCGTVDDGAHRIDVSEPNGLGVTSFETSRVLAQGNSVFSLQAFAADDSELASVRLTIGTIADLPQLLPGNDHGSEILVSVAGTDPDRVVTRETSLFRVRLPSGGAAAQLLAISEIASALAQQANLYLVKPTAVSAEDSYSTQVCSPAFMNTTPTALQCCYTNDTSGLGLWSYDTNGINTLFERASDAKVIERDRNPSGTGCKAQNGTGSCGGGLCYFGPAGFSHPQVLNWGASPVIQKFTINANHKTAIFCDDGSGTPTYGNVTGTFPTGEGCCGNGSGPCANSTACAACSPPGSDSGQGDFDY